MSDEEQMAWAREQATQIQEHLAREKDDGNPNP
jgi:ribosomal protein S15P/S13E